MQKTLNIGSMRLPKESATKGFGFIGKRGSGKSYGAAVFAEELYKVKVPFVVFDPIDVWWGLKVAADGKGKGLPIVVFGREHADIPLDRTMGRQIAEAVVKHNISCVISTFGMNKTEMREVVADFSERLLQINNTPRQVIIEEAHEFVPQRVQGAMAKCFSAVEALLVMGRNRGIGVTLLNQRMATLNKDLLTQIDVLVAFRSVGPQDRKAFRDWVEGHNDENDTHFDEFMSSVPSLPTGTAWVWSPEFLEKFEKVKFRARETFHPDREKLGMTFKMPEISQGDVQSFIDAFTKKPEIKRMEVVGKVLERSRDGIVTKFDLKGISIGRESREQQYTRLMSTPGVRTLLGEEYKNGYGEGEIAGIEKGRKESEAKYRVLINKCAQLLMRTHGDIDKAMALLKDERAAGARVAPPEGIRSPAVPPAHQPSHLIVDKEKMSRSLDRLSHNQLTGGDPGKLSTGARKVLSYLHGVHPNRKTKAQLWIAARYSPGGGFDNIVAELTSTWLVEKDRDGKYFSTEQHDPSMLDDTFDPSIRLWDAKLSKGARTVFHLFLEYSEARYTKRELAEATGYAMGGGFDNCVAELTSRKILKKDGTAYILNPEVLDI